MSRVGKLAWYWNQLNKDVLQQFQGIPDSHWRVIKLEEMTYSFYQEIAAFLGFNATLSAETYSSISNRRPNAFKNVPEVSDWSASEIAEFETEVYEIAVIMGYEHRVARIRDSRL